MDTILMVDKEEVPGIAVQCELLTSKGHLNRTYEFDIADIKLRRRLVSRFYGILILQVACTLPCLELLLRFPLPYNYVIPSTMVFTMSIYTCFYVWREWRRLAPFNYFVLFVSTCIGLFNRSVYLVTLVESHWVYFYPVVLILELLALMLYSSQERYRFTQFRGISIICLVFGMFLLVAYHFNRVVELFSGMACTLEAWYVIYDTHYMLCGRHGYTIGPQEYVFAACNIHCDLPKGIWRFIKMIFINKIMEMIRMFRECFRAEVC
ncbi:protein lifeguard 1 [Drosophila eugracilis]|uniref:protein lifeguard 1 n=1 Tax=Drosophila eugracilis TaxID=29029 RepID=UPI0007E6EEF5|nr:protein lifeguard 1 [Drosophila eugracilis]